MEDARTHGLIGAAMEVHRYLGCGFLEAVYQEAFALELTSRRIEFEREVAIPITYKGISLKTAYLVDFVCTGGVLIEIKALTALNSIAESQIINYLYASTMDIGLLLNFGSRSLEYRRFAGPRRKSV